MDKIDYPPLWVFLAFSSIETRVGATRLIWASVLFTLYCLPWPLFFSTQDLLINKVLIEDWRWFGRMLPIVICYSLSLRWMDKNIAWENSQ